MFAIGGTTMNSALEALGLPAPRRSEQVDLSLEMIAGRADAWNLLLPTGVLEIAAVIGLKLLPPKPRTQTPASPIDE